MSSNNNFTQAATVVLIRETDAGLEIYMTERPGTRDFPGLHVFPGGKVDAQDHQVEQYCVAMTDAEASRQLGVERGGLGYWVAAIRECFEEASVLLAYSTENESDDPAPPKNPTPHRLLKSNSIPFSFRKSLHSQSLPLSEFCREQNLLLATDRLHYFSHWITPASAPRRYDTRFFVCQMPAGQHVSHDESEVASSTWISPEQALTRFRNEQWLMIDPTLRTLEVLARYSTVQSLFKDIADDVHLQKVTQSLGVQGMQPASPDATGIE